MEILSLKYIGLHFTCQNCGAFCANVKENEIYEENAVYCAACHYKNFISYYKKYDGIIKESK